MEISANDFTQRPRAREINGRHFKHEFFVVFIPVRGGGGGGGDVCLSVWCLVWVVWVELCSTCV